MSDKYNELLKSYSDRNEEYRQTAQKLKHKISVLEVLNKTLNEEKKTMTPRYKSLESVLTDFLGMDVPVNERCSTGKCIEALIRRVQELQS